MNKNQKGIAPIVIILILVVFSAGGIMAWKYSSKAPKETTVQETKTPEEETPKETVTPKEETPVSGITNEQKMLGRDIARSVDSRQIGTALALYYSDFDKYPGTAGINQWNVIASVFFRYNLPSMPQEIRPGHPQYEYWISSDGQKYIFKATFETNDSKLYGDSDIDGWPLGQGKVYCGVQGDDEREYCVGEGF